MRRSGIWLGLAAWLLAAALMGCQGSSSSGSGTTTPAASPAPASAGPYTLTFTGSGFTPHVGQTFKVALVRVSDGAVIATQSTVIPAAAGFSFTFTGQLAAGTAYYVDYYADVDANTYCDAATDHVWRDASITAPTADVTLAVTHNTNFTPAACANLGPPPAATPTPTPPSTGPYTLSFSGTNFTPHPGQTLKAALVRSDGVVAGTKSTTVSSDGYGTFSVTFAGLLVSGASYFLDYYVDYNSNGVCDLYPTDHVWRNSSVTAVAGAVNLSVDHNATQNTASNACANL